MFLSREPVTVSPGLNVHTKSKRSKRSSKSSIIVDVDATPCITLDTIQEDDATYQSEPVEAVFYSEVQRPMVLTSESQAAPGSPSVSSKVGFW